MSDTYTPEPSPQPDSIEDATLRTDGEYDPTPVNEFGDDTDSGDENEHPSL